MMIQNNLLVTVLCSVFLVACPKPNADEMLLQEVEQIEQSQDVTQDPESEVPIDTNTECKPVSIDVEYDSDVDIVTNEGELFVCL